MVSVQSGSYSFNCDFKPHPIKDIVEQPIQLRLLLSKKLYPHCQELVGSRNGFKI